eukprot:gene22656-34680_t
MLPRLLTRRYCTSAVVRQLQGLGGGHPGVVDTVFQSLAENASELEIQREGLRALSRYDTDDDATQEVVRGWVNGDGRRVDGPQLVCGVLEKYQSDPATASECLKLMCNFCWLTLTDESGASNQALLGADGAVALAAQSLHKHGRTDEKLCSRGLQALLMLTMYNKDNARESVTNDALNLTIAMLKSHPESELVQDQGLALLIRLLTTPLDNNQADYVYEEDPLTTVSLLLSIARRHTTLQIQDKVWHGLKILAHNHSTLPHMARHLVPPVLGSMVEVLLKVAAGKSEEIELRDQMLSHSSKVVATLIEGDTAEVPTTALTKGDFARVAITALNKGVSEELDHVLSSLLLSLSSREDPVLAEESAMATLLMRLRGERTPETTKVTLQTLWNLLSYQDSQRQFVNLNGPSIVKDLPIKDEETQK